MSFCQIISENSFAGILLYLGVADTSMGAPVKQSLGSSLAEQLGSGSELAGLEGCAVAAH